MRRLPYVLLASCLAVLLLPGCVSQQYSHFFPRLQPLFVGLDETKLSPKAKFALAEAKVDFQLARRGEAPRYARYVGTAPHSDSKIYQGNGYRVTIVENWAFHSHSDGPEIVVDASVTGGKPLTYDEVDHVVD